MAEITITVGDVSLLGRLNDSPTAARIWEALPITGTARTWGEEIYFDIPLAAPLEPDARAEVEVGELAYWPMGCAFCIFFGPTPASTDHCPKAYSPVNVVGRVVGDATQLRAVRDGASVTLRRREGAAGEC